MRVSLFIFQSGLLVALGSTPAFGRLAPGPTVWMVSSMERVGRQDVPLLTTQVSLSAARGEVESFQIVVQAPPGGLSNVTVSTTDLLGTTPQRIPRSSLTLYREHYVQVKYSSPDRGSPNRPLGPGWYADALIPFTDPDTGLPLAGAALLAAPFAVAGGMNQPLWVDVHVPRNAAPGPYTGTWTLTSDQGQAQGNLFLRVWNFELPLKPSLTSLFQPKQASDLGVARELLRHRLMPGNLAMGSQLPSIAQQRELIDVNGLKAADIGPFSGADVSTPSMSPAPTPGAYQQLKANYASDLVLYDYSADEIDGMTALFPTLKQWAQSMHQAGIKNLVTMTPVPELYDDGSGTGRSAVDIWVVLPTMYDAAPTRVAEVLNKGDTVWSYNTLVQDSYSPKWEVDFAPINFRIQPGFINQSLGLTGLLYWRVDFWTPDPWNDIDYIAGGEHFPGDGILVYPGAPVGIPGVVPSLRLKWLMMGVQDYDYVQILKSLGQEAWAMNLVRSVASDWSTWTRDPSVLEAARMQMGAKIDSLSGNSAPGPGPSGGPSAASPSSGGGCGALGMEALFILGLGLTRKVLRRPLTAVFRRPWFFVEDFR